MAYEKLKTESYTNVKGINQKASVYVTGESEVLDLINYDFQTPGAWTKRWGYTCGVTTTGAKFSGTIYGFQSFISYTDFNNPNAKVDQRNVIFSPGGAYDYDPTTGMASLMFAGSSLMAGQQATIPNRVDWTVFGDFMFFSSFAPTSTTLCRVWKFGMSEGSSLTQQWGLFGQPALNTTGFSIVANSTLIGASLSNSTYNYYFAYLDQYSYTDNISQPGKMRYFFGPVDDSYSVTLAAFSGGYASIYVPSVSMASNGNLYRPTVVGVFRNKLFGNFPSDHVGLIGVVGQNAVFSDVNSPESINVANSYYGYPATFDYEFANNGVAPFGSKFLETWNSRLWLVQMTTNRVYYSEIMDPQNILAESYRSFAMESAEITGIKAFGEMLLVFFEKGVFRIVGDDVFSVQEITKEFGTVNDKSIVMWRERVWFQDQGQIIEYDGSTFRVVSERLKYFTDQVRVDSSVLRSFSYHFAARSEVWFCMPWESSSNTRAFVYDYDVDSWTTFKFGSMNPSYVGNLNFSGNSGVTTFTDVGPITTFLGAQGGSLYYFDPSFLSDDGTGFTCMVETRNHEPLGRSTTSQFRRLFIDCNAQGVTYSFKTEFYADFATTTISLTATINTYQFQARYEFGIPAKALRMKIFCNAGGAPHQLMGYTLESRFQRKV